MASARRIRLPGSLSYVTCWGTSLRPLFGGRVDYREYLRLLDRYRRRLRFFVHCYCLFPEEIHLLLENPDGDVSRAMQSLGTAYAIYSNKRYRQAGHLFARPYRHVVVEKTAFALEASRLIHLLPVVKGLVTDPVEYPWSSVRAYLARRDDPVVTTSPILSLLGPRRDVYRAYAAYLPRGSGYAWDPQGSGDKAVGSSAFQSMAARAAAPPSLPARRPLEHLAAAAARHYGVSTDNLLLGRSREQTRRRHVLMYVAKTLGGYSLRQIGRLCGDVAPSTVHHAVERVAATLPDSPEAREVEALARELFSERTL